MTAASPDEKNQWTNGHASHAVRGTSLGKSRTRIAQAPKAAVAPAYYALCRILQHKAGLSDVQAVCDLKLGLETDWAENRIPYRVAPSRILPNRKFFFRSVAATSSPET
jgi:hypothetical protein